MSTYTADDIDADGSTQLSPKQVTLRCPFCAKAVTRASFCDACAGSLTTPVSSTLRLGEPSAGIIEEGLPSPLIGKSSHQRFRSLLVVIGGVLIVFGLLVAGVVSSS